MEGADLVGVEGDRIRVLVAVIGAVGGYGGGEAGDQNRHSQNREGVLHGSSSVVNGVWKKIIKQEM